MDGNGRWAELKGFPRIEGHREGVKRVGEIISAANELKLNALTLYVFSMENWQRPRSEVDALMTLLNFYLRNEMKKFVRDNVIFRAIGELERLPESTRRLLKEFELMLWHSLGLDNVFKQLESGKKGLSFGSAKQRLKEFGPNEIKLERKIFPLKIFAAQFKSFLVVVLLAAAFVSFIVSLFPGYEDNLVNAVLIFVIVIANGVFGFFQEFKAEKSLEALKKMSPDKAIVLRNGQKQVIDAVELVPGDVIF